MSKELIFTLTGNFQYDLGILGLKNVLDFFQIEYESDGKFYISVKRNKEQLLEDIIAKLMIDNGVNYFSEKIIEALKKKDKNKELDKTLHTNVNNLSDKILTYYPNKGLESIVEDIYKQIEPQVKQDISNRNELLKEIKGIIWQKGVNLLNNILLNFQPDMKATGKDTLEKAKNKLNKDIVEGKICSFCNQNDGKRLTRDVFFFAPAQFNVSWFNEPNLFICPDCLVVNLAITKSFIFLGNKQNAIVVYTPNLEDMKEINSGIKNKFNDNDGFYIGKVITPIIEYEKVVLKKEAFVKELQLLNFKLDPKEPQMEMIVLTKHSIYNLIKIEEELKNLFNKNNIKSLFAFIKQKDKYMKIDLSAELIRYISLNQKIYYLVQKFARYCVMSEIFRQNKTENPPLINFSAWLFLNFLKIHYKLEDKDMNEFESFKEIGKKIRQRVYMILTDNNAKHINWNTFENKIISLSNSFLNSAKGSFQQFQELLCRTIITNGLNVKIDTINLITKENYSEIATTIALALLVAQSNEIRQKDASQLETMVEEI